jgi:hypothetical protein
MIVPGKLMNRLDATVIPAPQEVERGYPIPKEFGSP